MRVLYIVSTVSQSNSVGKIASEISVYAKENNNIVRLIILDDSVPFKDYQVKIKSRFAYRFLYQLSIRSNFFFNQSPLTIRRIKKEILYFKPDLIHIIQPCNTLINNYSLLKMIGKYGYPCVYTMIDENAYLGNCDNAYDCCQFKKGCHLCNGQNAYINTEDYHGRWSKIGCRRIAKQKEKAYNSISNICFVAPKWVVERAQSSYLLSGKKFYVVDEYVNNHSVYYPRNVDSTVWRERGIDISKVIVLNVARYSNTRKGVEYFIELARKLEKDNRFIFLNIGFDGDVNTLPSNYIPIPFVSNQNELAEYYSVSDLAMITSLSDTMPNTSLEALSCGTPVCGFNITGIPYVAERPLGEYVEPRNVEALKKIVLNTAKKDDDLSRQCREYALKRYAPEVSGSAIMKIYEEMVKRKSLIYGKI